MVKQMATRAKQVHIGQYTALCKNLQETEEEEEDPFEKMVIVCGKISHAIM